MPESASPIEVKKSAEGEPRPPEKWAPLYSLRREIDRLFDDFDTNRWPVSGAMRLFSDMPPIPAMDLVESDGHYDVTAELPGMDPKQLEIKVAGDTLVIKGEKREETERKDKDHHVSERRYGTFQRTMRLPEDADRDKIAARYANGILTVTVPKSPGKKPSEKKIEVKAG